MPLLVLDNIHKSFGAVQALRGVHMEVHPGEVHGLIGENGAGKSTLMKVLSGVHQPDEGHMVLDGERYKPVDALDGRRAGISMIYQELILAPHLTVEENITLGLEHTRWGWIRPRTVEVREALSWLGQASMAPDTPVHQLSLGKQQLVEIARALIMDARIVVMDEPTSSLSEADTQALFEVIGRLKARGVAIIYISHFLDEVKILCDRYTVLRDGESVATGLVREAGIGKLVEAMVGRSVDELYPPSEHTVGEPLLRVAQLEGEGLPRSVSFTLHRGEILGIAGLVGSGRTEAVRALFGLEPARQGRVNIKGHPEISATYLNPQTALEQGIDLLSEDRKGEGLALNLSILTNLTLSGLRRYSRMGLIRKDQEARGGRRWIEALRIKTPDPNQPVLTLSGGNQQKVCLARLLHHDSDILFLDEPTRGIDIGSKAEIYRLIHQWAHAGKGMVLISSYLPELMGMSDRLGVMYRGKLSEIRPKVAWTESEIMHFATTGLYEHK